VLASFFGGALVDRLGFKRISVVADLASAVTTATIPLLAVTTGLSFWQLLVLVFLGAVLDTPGGTARMGLLPDLATLARTPPERANAASQTIFGVSSFVGPLLAGVLIALLGTRNVLWLDAASFVVSAALVALVVPRPAIAQATATARYLDDVLAGLRFLLDHRLLRAILLTATVINFILAPIFGVVMPVYADARFDRAEAFGALMSGLGAGAILGSLVYGAIGPRLPRRLSLSGGVLLLGLPLPLLVLDPPLLAAVGSVALAGFGSGVINPMVLTLFQSWTPEAMRGRVFGTLMAAASVASPVAMLAGGTLIEAVGVDALLVASGGLLLAVSAAMLRSPSFRQLD
jgi:MFS family permease